VLFVFHRDPSAFREATDYINIAFGDFLVSLLRKDGVKVPSGSTQLSRPTRFVVPDLCNAPALVVLVLVGQLLVLVLLLAGGSVTWERLALMSLYVQWVAMTSAALLCWVRPWLLKVGLANGALIAFLLVMTVVFAVSLVAERLLVGWLSYTERALDWARIGGQMAIAGIITGMVLRYFYVQQQLREQEQSELQSRIQALQSRIRPHFLFNSMNIIASLIATDPETAESVVEDLSELFRASLNDAGNQVSLAEELALCERYVRIEGLRLGDRLRIDWDISVQPETIKIPLLTLQPLLENAIYHGIQPLPEGGTITVRVRHEGGRVHVRITNPIPPPEARGETQGNRMAVNNIKSRLTVLYGADADLIADTDESKSCYVTLLHYPHPNDPRATESHPNGPRRKEPIRTAQDLTPRSDE
jgi:two-component system sensor histidine kinase AlgZ